MIKFSASSERLAKALQIANSAINPKMVMPILENFLFDIKKNTLQIHANDLENAIRVEMEVSSETEGRVCIPSKIILEYLKNIDQQPLVISVHEDYTIEIVSDKGRYKLKGEDAANFPKYPDKENTTSIQLPSQVLHKAIDKTIFAVSNDDVRPALTGIFFEMHPDAVRLVTTDAHRLVYYDIGIDETSSNLFKAIVPKKAGNIIKGFLTDSGDEKNELSFNNNHLFLKHGNIELISRLVDAEFPDYKNVIPQNAPYSLNINKDELLCSVLRLNVFSNRSTNMIVFHIEGNLVRLSTEDSDYAREGIEELAAEYNGELLQIAFNGQFLTEMLKSIHTEQIVMQLSAPQKPGLIFPMNEEGNAVEEHLMLIMPLIV